MYYRRGPLFFFLFYSFVPSTGRGRKGREERDKAVKRELRGGKEEENAEEGRGKMKRGKEGK